MTGKKRETGRNTQRELKVKVKTARGRKLSSTRWLERQLNDPYVAEAKRLGLRSRAAFKLIQIDDQHQFLKPGAKVVEFRRSTWRMVLKLHPAGVKSADWNRDRGGDRHS